MEAALSAHDYAKVEALIPPVSNKKEWEIRAATFERLLRHEAISMAQSKASLSDIEEFLLFVVRLADECVPKSLTVSVMQDLLDCSSKRRCAEIFTIVEKNIKIWKSPQFFNECKNSVLRMCNDLHKRLSRTIDTQFCGRINVLLARSLPLNERSGLNITSQFNTTNDTEYDHEIDSTELIAAGEGGDKAGVQIDSTPEIPVDFELYTKFWELQKYFCDPKRIHTNFKVFQNNLNEVLNVFTTFKLEKPHHNDRQPTFGVAEAMEGVKRPDIFFAKYQTSQKLVHLQFADSQFRRYFLVQCLILVNYLQSDVKFRDVTEVLTDDQAKYIAEVGEKCFKLLRETYPHAFRFTEFVKRVLSREKIWSTWKNDGCPDVLANRPERVCNVFKRPLPRLFDSEKVDLDNQVLNKLCSFQTNNLAVCSAPDRNFVPSVDEVVDEALDHADPDQGVEADFSCFNDEQWCWRINRLFLSESDAFLTFRGKKMCFETAELMQRACLAIAATGDNAELQAKAAEVSTRVEQKRQQMEEDAKQAAKEAEEQAKVARQQAEEEAKRRALEAQAERKRKDEEQAAKRAQELEEMRAKRPTSKTTARGDTAESSTKSASVSPPRPTPADANGADKAKPVDSRAESTENSEASSRRTSPTTNKDRHGRTRNGRAVAGGDVSESTEDDSQRERRGNGAAKKERSAKRERSFDDLKPADESDGVSPPEKKYRSTSDKSEFVVPSIAVKNSFMAALLEFLPTKDHELCRYLDYKERGRHSDSVKNAVQNFVHNYDSKLDKLAGVLVKANLFDSKVMNLFRREIDSHARRPSSPPPPTQSSARRTRATGSRSDRKH